MSILSLLFVWNPVFAVNDFVADFENATEKQNRYILNDLGITGGAVSYEFWMRLESNPASVTDFIGQGDSGTLTSWSIRYDANGANFDLRFKRSRNWVSDVFITQTSANIGTGNWRHIAGTYDGTDMRLYSAPAGGTHTLVAGPTTATGNGATSGSDHFAVATADDTQGNSFASNAIGRHHDGLIDEVRVWNDERTIGELDDNFECELAGTEAGLRAYYQFEESWDDFTANAFHLINGEGSPTASSTLSLPFTAGTCSAGAAEDQQIQIIDFQ